MCENERILLEKAKNGDVQAFELLVEGYQKKVFNVALRMMGNYDDAGEIAQEAFIRVFKSIKSFKEESTFSTWIYRITTNICLDELRKRKNKKIISIDEDIRFEDGEAKRQIEDFKPTPDVIAEKNEIKKIVTDAINSLSEEHRLVLVMRDIQGFSYEEIAKITKCPEGTVKSRINRARQALKEILKNNKELFNNEYVK
jgi:RNA polymerase sigma-70 factor, ECF subfamily